MNAAKLQKLSVVAPRKKRSKKSRGREPLTSEQVAMTTALQTRAWELCTAYMERESVSINELAERMGWAKGMLNHIAKKEKQSLTAYKLAELARFFDASLDWIVFGDPEKVGAGFEERYGLASPMLVFLSQVEHMPGLRAWLGTREGRETSLATVARGLRILEERGGDRPDALLPPEGWAEFFLKVASGRSGGKKPGHRVPLKTDQRR